jgi:hypothetical protein
MGKLRSSNWLLGFCVVAAAGLGAMSASPSALAKIHSAMATSADCGSFSGTVAFGTRSEGLVFSEPYATVTGTIENGACTETQVLVSFDDGSQRFGPIRRILVSPFLGPSHRRDTFTWDYTDWYAAHEFDSVSIRVCSTDMQAGRLIERCSTPRQLLPALASPFAVTVEVTRPAAGQPAAGQPAAGQPAAGQPATGQPATGQPAPAAPPSADPPAAPPVAANPYPQVLALPPMPANCPAASSDWAKASATAERLSASTVLWQTVTDLYGSSGAWFRVDLLDPPNASNPNWTEIAHWSGLNSTTHYPFTLNHDTVPGSKLYVEGFFPDGQQCGLSLVPAAN